MFKASAPELPDQPNYFIKNVYMSINYFRKYPKKMLLVLKEVDKKLGLKNEDDDDFKFDKENGAEVMQELKNILHEFKSVP